MKYAAWAKVVHIGILASVVSVAVTAALWFLTDTWLASASRQATNAAWAEEGLWQARNQIAALSPIAAANACGMGASSCFKCHNGTRAAAPGMDKQKSPWHLQHKTVNYSCVGCHHGNPRLIKKELAHADLIKDSRARPDTCEACHKGANVAELLSSYRK